jgi:hypothetical protein
VGKNRKREQKTPEYQSVAKGIGMQDIHPNSGIAT